MDILSRSEADATEAYTIEEIRAILGVSRSTVLGILRAKLFPYTISECRCAIPRVSFDKWLHELQAEENA